ncbi:MAG: CRISPR-associated protein Cas4 [Candidatus Woesearchaeota archaeon]
MISVTELACFEYCPRKLFLLRTLEVKEPLSREVVIGRLKHAVFDFLNKEQERIVTEIQKMDKDFIEKTFRAESSNVLLNVIKENSELLNKFNISLVEAYKLTWNNILSEIKDRTSIIYNFMLKTGLYGRELWNALTPKIESEVSISDEELELCGRVDRILSFENEIIPVELKTGRIPKEGVWSSHRIQAEAYMFLVKKVKNGEVKKAIIKYLDYDEERSVYYNPFVDLKIKMLVKQVLEILNSKKPPKILNNNKCKFCRLKSICFGV